MNRKPEIEFSTTVATPDQTSSVFGTIETFFHGDESARAHYSEGRMTVLYEDEEILREACQELFGRELFAADWIGLAGVVDGSTIRVRVAHVVEEKGVEWIVLPVIFISTHNPQIYDELVAQKIFRKGRKLILIDESIKLQTKCQGGGLGLRGMTKQILTAKRLGVGRIELSASRTDKNVG